MLKQAMLFDVDEDSVPTREATSSTFVDNMRLPIHGWNRYSAGFSVEWAQSVIRLWLEWRRPSWLGVVIPKRSDAQSLASELFWQENEGRMTFL